MPKKGMFNQIKTTFHDMDIRNKRVAMLQKGLFINETALIKDALKQLDKCAEKVLLVVNKKYKLLGTVTDGDIRRFILKGTGLDENIRDVYHREPTVIRKKEFSVDFVKKLLIRKKVGLLPILDDEGYVVDYITWDQFFSEEETVHPVLERIGIPVVIMAGGKGTRLEPFTTVLPKPLIPINNKPIIEIIIDEFRNQGAGKYYLILNYRGEMIEAYFKGVKKDYELNCVWESDFFGTAGGLRLLEDKIDGNFIVSNCDVIVKADFGEVISMHKKRKATMTVLSSIQHYKIPYGVVQFKEKGEVTGIMEKPEYTLTVNTGVYILNADCLRFIPEKAYFDMTDLMKSLISANKRVITYPVNENEYIDTGQWDEYRKAVVKLQLFQ